MPEQFTKVLLGLSLEVCLGRSDCCAGVTDHGMETSNLFCNLFKTCPIIIINYLLIIINYETLPLSYVQRMGRIKYAK